MTTHITCLLTGEILCRLQLNSSSVINHLLPAMKTGIGMFESDIIPQETTLPTIDF